MTTETTLYDQWCEVKDRFAAEECAAQQARTLAAHAGDPAPDARGRALRHDGWTPDRQRRFLELIAQGYTVVNACAAIGLSKQGAYALRDRAGGAAFALGWAAANLKAREPLSDELFARAMDGQVERIIRPDGSVVERHRYDNGLATRLLARLDRQAAGTSAADAAARLIAAEFEAYLDAIGRDEGPARAGLFIAARADQADDLEPVRALARADRYVRAGAGLASEVAADDLDPAARATWTAEQWARAEATGLLRIAAAPDKGQEGQLVPEPVGDAAAAPVWWDEQAEEYRTRFAPPPEFDGEENGDFSGSDYERELTPAELAIVEAAEALDVSALRAASVAERDGWFADLAATIRNAGGLPNDGPLFAADDPATDELVTRAVEPAPPGEAAGDPPYIGGSEAPVPPPLARGRSGLT